MSEKRFRTCKILAQFPIPTHVSYSPIDTELLGVDGRMPIQSGTSLQGRWPLKSRERLEGMGLVMGTGDLRAWMRITSKQDHGEEDRDRVDRGKLGCRGAGVFVNMNHGCLAAMNEDDW